MLQNQLGVESVDRCGLLLWILPSLNYTYYIEGWNGSILLYTVLALSSYISLQYHLFPWDPFYVLKVLSFTFWGHHFQCFELQCNTESLISISNCAISKNHFFLTSTSKLVALLVLCHNILSFSFLFLFSGRLLN